ncbi:MAG TPA: hypothetical protein VFQ38_00530 [Longimicrobiales bacterium]|nr:hypothetical protein [Longimicrobiales bacterium]
MRLRSGRLLAVLLVVGGLACAGSRSHRAHPDMSLITREQIEAKDFHTAFDVVAALHSNWLSARGPDTLLGRPSEVLVYLDDTRLGGVETLRTIEIGLIVYIRHFDGKAATARWGVGHGQGVILVSTHPM